MFGEAVYLENEESTFKVMELKEESQASSDDSAYSDVTSFQVCIYIYLFLPSVSENSIPIPRVTLFFSSDIQIDYFIAPKIIIFLSCVFFLHSLYKQKSI